MLYFSLRDLQKHCFLSSAEHRHNLIHRWLPLFECTKCSRFWCKTKFFYSFESIQWISWQKCFFLAYITEQLYCKTNRHCRIIFLSLCLWEAGLALHLRKVYSLHLRFDLTQWSMAWMLFIALLVLDSYLQILPLIEWYNQRLPETVQRSFK